MHDHVHSVVESTKLMYGQKMLLRGYQNQGASFCIYKMHKETSYMIR